MCILLAIIGLGISGYLLQNHHANKSSVCDISATVSCSYINASSFATLLSVPVAALGILWLIFFISGLRKIHQKQKFFPLFYLWLLLGGCFVVYLIIGEIVLGAICPFCTLIHILVAFFIILFTLLSKDRFRNLKKTIIQEKNWLIAVILSHVLLLLIYQFV